MRYNLGMATHNSVRISHNKTKKKRGGGWFSYKIKHVASSNLLHKQTDTNQKHCLWSCNQWTTVLTNAGRGSQTTCVCWWHTLIPTGRLFCGRNWTPSRTDQPVFTQAVSSSVYMLLESGPLPHWGADPAFQQILSAADRPHQGTPNTSTGACYWLICPLSSHSIVD